MRLVRVLLALVALVLPGQAATLGTVINITGGASDLVLDDTRGLLYLVRPAPYNRIDIFSVTQRRVLSSVLTDALPLSAALSRDGNILYVTCHDGSSLNIIDTRANPPAVVQKVSLPAKPEGVAVGADGRVLITTIGSGAGNLLNTLLIYDASVTDTARTLLTVPVATPPPLPPVLPPLSGRAFLANRSQLIATRNGERIIGVNGFNNTQRVVFVYESASGSVIRSRIVNDTSTVLSVSPDGARFMMGLRLFETETLSVLAQQNAANAPFPLSVTVTAAGFTQVGGQFNLQQNQGGSAFTPDGSRIFAAFNIAPIQNPPARANVTQLLIDDPDNLLIYDALQLPENLAGKIVASLDGSALYALSESGITIIPVNEIARSPVLQPSTNAVVVATDPCNSVPETRSFRVDIANVNRTPGPLNVTTTLLQQLSTTTNVNVPGIGGGLPGPGGGGIVIPIPGPGGGIVLPGNPNQNPAAAALQQAPTVRVLRDGNSTSGFEFSINAVAARSLGTSQSYDYLLSAPQAVNVPSVVRVYQNGRNPEARGNLVPIRTSLSPSEGLTDLVIDSVRQRLYIANSGMNRVEVYDLRQRRLLNPIKVGQLPRTLAMSPDNATLFVANSGSESVSIVDPERLEVTGRIKFPPIPFNGNVPIVTPSHVGVTQRGVQIVMSNGTLWRVVGDEAVPRAVSPIIGSVTVPAPRTLTVTPNGEYMLLLAGNGNAYLYDAQVDDYVQARQVAPAPVTGYFGPVSAGARGQYYVVNGLVLNQSLSPIAGSTPTPGGPGGGPAATTTRPIAAVVAGSGTVYARFTQPVIANANTVVSDTPAVELVDATTGGLSRSVAALEGPLSRLVGNQRVNVEGRMMAIDAALANAYLLTISGLSIIPLDVIPPTARPVVAANGIVNVGTYAAGAAQNGLISIFGSNLGASATASGTPLPTLLGGLCVTLNNAALPLLMTSTGQVNAQIPPNLAAGRYPLVVRSVERKAAATPVQLTVARYSPAALADPATKRALLYRSSGAAVTAERPARRDEPLVLYAVGLGIPARTTLAAGAPAPSSPLIETDDVQLYFRRVASPADLTRGPTVQEEMIVDWSGLVPGYVGLYQINLRVPGFHEKGPDLRVVLRIGGVESPLTGPLVPTVPVE
ncbi:MAG: hypothetical protein ACK58M_03650 [Acidobacteriota bacterium]|jgi:uncharacterized protein (TIGR03437 family)|nr:hypothetical protein [Bryobacteraceae bacterium CoA2 C42]